MMRAGGGGGGGGHGGPWSILNSTDEKPQVTWVLLKRVMQYSRPYIWLILAMLIITLLTSGLSLLNPLILRQLIDQTLPHKDLHQLTWLVVALLAMSTQAAAQDAEMSLGEYEDFVFGAGLLHKPDPTPRWGN